MIDENIINLAHRMADTAGDIAQRYFRTDLGIENKADLSPVTQADREIESTLRALIESYFPDHGIVGEEFGNLRENAAFKWVLDPIDGTRAFIAGIPTFTTLISLTQHGIPILGIIDQPITKERWLGIGGEKTRYCHSRESGNPVWTMLDSRFRGNDNLLSAQARLATTSIPYFTPPQTQAFEALKSQYGPLTLGGDAYLYGMLASGRMDIVIDAGLKPYDFCALRPVIEGAGGIFTDWNGQPVTLGSDGRVIAAATKELHQAAITFLQPKA